MQKYLLFLYSNIIQYCDQQYQLISEYPHENGIVQCLPLSWHRVCCNIREASVVVAFMWWWRWRTPLYCPCWGILGPPCLNAVVTSVPFVNHVNRSSMHCSRIMISYLFIFKCGIQNGVLTFPNNLIRLIFSKSRL